MSSCPARILSAGLRKQSLHTSRRLSIRGMSQKAQVLGTEEAKVDGVKWLRMEKIKWKDEDGKEVCHFYGSVNA